jgi:hypothetical protein
MPEKLTFCEGGINWSWYTELELNTDDTVTILAHYRVHNGDAGHPECTPHNGYYRQEIWRESTDGKRTALAYHVPTIGWRTIRNQQNVFSYSK